ncbi:type I-C CRISPR-associated protein Cas8c/Csd1 [Bifidobacterium sp. ESL0682]|uniref:type I-C CRISPR-associated protein Cas8c/Csd1 n=1 Tax=Bifidobacterium sp. ESL0682 TaxID=2983212 RepID=UPI0023F8401D|nr:type I-C CRISPR-associated protein Cas8c/Csd1 [Bifidobacterium sp. ESL0682]WEV41496.1 type I-C CRISPR-associated protein Cas8c/Csd1 [Bifidobacterium sp. ESL0682]
MKVEKQLIQSMFSNSSLPRGLALSAFNNVIRPASYEKENQWKRDLEITCSIWKSIYIQNGKGITMELDEQRQDRDYLYGRLLALADHLERGVLWKQNADRPTTAVKLMTNFAAKPYTTWGNIMLQLAPYIKSLNGSQWFQNDIDEVMALFKNNEYEDNHPLTPLYLMGYSQERRKLQKKKQRKQKSIKVELAKEK